MVEAESGSTIPRFNNDFLSFMSLRYNSFISAVVLFRNTVLSGKQHLNFAHNSSVDHSMFGNWWIGQCPSAP
jgi:hypothetical protein